MGQLGPNSLLIFDGKALSSHNQNIDILQDKIKIQMRKIKIFCTGINTKAFTEKSSIKIYISKCIVIVVNSF